MVAAQETTLRELLEGTKQYQVPLYQRTYSWKTDQLQRLWDDITKLAEDRLSAPSATHFIGSLVLAPSPSIGPTGVQEFLVIDGQQRLTTLTVLLCAIRDYRAQHENQEHRDRINELYLLNKWKSDSQRLKLLPTQADRAAYRACLESTPQAGGSDRIGSAYRFFQACLADADDPEDLLDIERIEDAVISGLALVCVTAQHGDNPHRIFESLNNTGLRLTQGDLLRNYLFMRMPHRAERVYTSLWLPLQELLSTEQLEQLFWIDLVLVDPKAKQTDTYAGQQIRLDRLRTEDDIENEVRRFSQLAALFKVVLDPTREPDEAVRLRLRRLVSWGSTTVQPLILHLLSRRAQRTAEPHQIADAMLYIESFLVRRLLSGRATNNLNRILLSAVSEIPKNQTVDAAVRTYLSTGRKYFTGDAALKNYVQTLPFYLNGRPGQRALVLRWLEESYGSKEPVALETLTIEHVLPQSLTPEGRKDLAADLGPGEDVDEVHEALVHTLGNLTLSGYNQSLSNSPFPTKKPKLAASGLAMNQDIAGHMRWGRAEILSRSGALADRIATLWPGPLDVADDRSGVRWDLMNRALLELPAGRWTTYGDLAALIGSHPVPVGMRLATKPAPHEHRVLQADGAVSAGFRWLDPTRSDDPKDLLRAEGVAFDEYGRADPTQRISLRELADLCGLTEVDAPPGPETPGAGQDPALRDRFLEQLRTSQTPDTVHGVLTIIEGWVGIGGHLEYGTADETSCFLFVRPIDQPRNLWPIVIYPAGRVEVVFQHLQTRPPFDDVQLRDEFRQRLNHIGGVDIPESKLNLRPGFDLALIANESHRSILADTLSWFYLESQPWYQDAVHEEVSDSASVSVESADGPVLLRLTDRSAVRRAASECERTGRDTFLAQYGFQRYRRYALILDGAEYDSKAIAGVAYGYQHPDQGVPHDFSGGVTRGAAARRLADLGFDIVDKETGKLI